jgi:hypothetical protein
VTDRPEPIFLLAGDADVERHVTRVVPEAQPVASALEALAALATCQGPAVLVASPAALGHRHEQILGALERQLPEVRVLLVATPTEEPLARRLAGDDYFLVPFGLGELSRTLFPSEPETEPIAAVSSATETTETQAMSDAHLATEAWRTNLQRIADTAGQAPAAIAQTTVNTLVTVRGVEAAAVLADGLSAPPLAAAGNQASWSAAAEATVDPTLTPNQWTPLGDHLWIFLHAAAQERGPALAVCGAEPGLSLTVLDDLAAAARVALSLVAAARVREAAIRVLSTDAETGLASRRYLDHFLDLAVRRAAENHREVTLALVSPSGNTLLSRSALQALAGMLKHDFPSGRAPGEGTAVRLARSDLDTLAVVFAGAAGGPSPQERLTTFAQRVAEASLPAPVAIASASYPWHAVSAAALMDATTQRLAKSRTSGLPIID